jgi:hypothetical protein
VVAHFQGKAFNPGYLLEYQLVDVGGGPMIRELKWEETGKNCVCARKHISQGDLPPQRKADTT